MPIDHPERAQVPAPSLSLFHSVNATGRFQNQFVSFLSRSQGCWSLKISPPIIRGELLQNISKLRPGSWEGSHGTTNPHAQNMYL